MSRTERIDLGFIGDSGANTTGLRRPHHPVRSRARAVPCCVRQERQTDPRFSLDREEIQPKSPPSLLARFMPFNDFAPRNHPWKAAMSDAHSKTDAMGLGYPVLHGGV
jgi:hypothetical protein